MSKLALYYLNQFSDKPKQTTDYQVGEIVFEKDITNPEQILDTLFILEAHHGNLSSEDPEEYTSYYKFYSFNENDIWDYESLDNGSIIFYERGL